MRIATAVLVLVFIAAPAPAQDGLPPQSPTAQSKAAPKVGAAGEKKAPKAAQTKVGEKAPEKKAPPKAPEKAAGDKKASEKGKAPPGAAARELYAGVSLAERVGIQFDLAWTGDYNGLITGEVGDRLLAAVKAFQKVNRFKETGLLAPPERALLATAAKAKQEHVGWGMVEDKATGALLGLPTRQVPNMSAGKSGTRWSSAQGQVQVETFRIRGPGTTLASAFEQQKKEPDNRKVALNVLRNDYFILSGLQGLKKFYVRAEMKEGEVRGVTLLYDQATEGIMDPVAVVMSSAFAPFPGGGLTAFFGPPPRRKVEYATGIVVSAQGHIITDPQVTDGCNVVEIAGFGDADRLAEDKASGLALLRLHGAAGLVPLQLGQEAVRTGDLVLAGIADPQAQGGARAASTVAARFSGDAVLPVPQVGFAGAAALDRGGSLLGMVALKTPVLASAAASVQAPQATVVGVETVRAFLDTHAVAPATGRSGVDAAKAALVRVICVRK